MAFQKQEMCSRTTTRLVCWLILFHAIQLRADDSLGDRTPVTEISPTAEAIDFFESKIRPLFLNRCTECHGDSDPDGELSLTSREGLIRGGTLGPVVVPGKPKESLLISVINHDGFLKMPPKEKLPTSELALLSKWILMGAPWPATNTKTDISKPIRENDAGFDKESEQAEFTQEQKNFWSYQPLQWPKPPDRKSVV